jgi:hypothetical protein
LLGWHFGLSTGVGSTAEIPAATMLAPATAEVLEPSPLRCRSSRPAPHGCGGLESPSCCSKARHGSFSTFSKNTSRSATSARLPRSPLAVIGPFLMPSDSSIALPRAFLGAAGRPRLSSRATMGEWQTGREGVHRMQAGPDSRQSQRRQSLRAVRCLGCPTAILSPSSQAPHNTRPHGQK